MFTMLVIMAIVSTVVTTPALRYYLTRTSLKSLAPAPARPPPRPRIPEHKRAAAGWLLKPRRRASAPSQPLAPGQA